MLPLLSSILALSLAVPVQSTSISAMLDNPFGFWTNGQNFVVLTPNGQMMVDDENCDIDDIIDMDDYSAVVGPCAEAMVSGDVMKLRRPLQENPVRLWRDISH